MNTVYGCKRGNRGMSPVYHMTRASAERFATRSSGTNETWEVRTFVDLEGVCETIDAYCAGPNLPAVVLGQHIVKYIREAVSDA